MVSYSSWPTSTHPEGHVNLSLRYIKLKRFLKYTIKPFYQLTITFFSDKKKHNTCWQT